MANHSIDTKVLYNRQTDEGMRRTNESDSSSLPELFTIYLNKENEERFRRVCQENGFFTEIFNIITAFPKRCVVFIFGSSIEGTQVQDSDIDILSCYEDNIKLIEKSEDGLACEQEVLMIIDSMSSPGYVKLQIVENGKPITVNHSTAEQLLTQENIFKDCNGRVVRSGFTFPHHIFPFPFTTTGPAKTMIRTAYKGKRFSGDMVHALRYNSWPNAANEWLSRERKYGWPSEGLKEHFKSLGCFLVEVGSPGSEENNLEWRISFSLQERELMFALNDVQFECYLTLKKIKLHYFNTKTGKSISSYHCKTCIFYMIERNPQSFWVPENLVECVRGCLKVLLDWVNNRNCPNYFIQNENMFQRITDHTVWQTLSCILHRLINHEIEIRFEFKHDQPVDFFENPIYQSFFQIESICFMQSTLIKYAAFECVNISSRILQLHKKSNDFVFHKKEYLFKMCEALVQKLSLLQQLEMFVNTEHTAEENRAAIYLVFPFLHTSLASHFAAYALQCETGAEKEEFKFSALVHFNTGVSSDLSSGRLKKIAYLYITGHLILCTEELMSLEKRFKGHVLNFSLVFPCQVAHTENRETLSFLKKYDYSSSEFAETFMSAFLVFYPTEIELLPFALKCESFKTVSSGQNADFFRAYVFIDSQIFMYFYMYLIAKDLDKPQKERLTIIHQMEKALSNTFHLETAFNLVAWAYAEEGFIEKAMMYFVMSWRHLPNDKDYQFQHKTLKLNPFYKYRPGGKSAMWHITLLFWRLLFTDIKTCIDTTFRLCYVCYKQKCRGMQKCSKCNVQYCSAQCLINDWKDKFICHCYSQ